jgi:hypothetical protein
MATEREVQPSVPAAEEVYEENVQQEAEQEYAVAQETTEHLQETKTVSRNDNDGRSRSGFIDGLSVGLGIGCIGAFVITWISVFFTPKMPSSITYENLLSVFIYPLIYLFAVGLIALTAGIVRQYYSMRR